MKRITYIITCILINSLHSQTANLLLENGQINVASGAYVNVEGDVVNTNNNLSINNGEIKLSGDWYNNSTSSFLDLPANGNVLLYGANQSINGQLTTFNSLTLGGGTVVKTLNCDAATYGVLDLNDAKLETNDRLHYHKNEDATSIWWDKGYVSSNVLGGYLVRKTNSENEYIFPVGSSNLTDIYRPVAINPNYSYPAEFAVRCAGIDPDLEVIGTSLTNAVGPFLRKEKEFEVKEINDQFYHNIYQINGRSGFDCKIAYFSNDGDFESLGQWNLQSKWEDLKTTTESGSFATFYNQPNKFTTFRIENPINDVFALIKPNDIQSVYVPNAFSPNGDGINDGFIPVLYGFEDVTEYKLRIFNRWGEIIFESSNPNIEWTGNWINYEAFLGVYVWKLSFKGSKKGKIINYNEMGHVSLLR